MESEETLKQLGKRLKDRRHTLSMTLVEVSKSAHVAGSTLQRLEAGSLNVSLEVLLEVCAALGISVSAALSDVPFLIAPTPMERLLRRLPTLSRGQLLAVLEIIE